MSKILIKDYVFDPITKTVLLDVENQEQILLIANVSARKLLYMPYQAGMGGEFGDGILTLECSTAGMAPADKLQIFVDADPEAAIATEIETLKEMYTIDTNMQQVFGSNRIISPDGKLAVKAVNPVLRETIGKLYAVNQMVNIDCADAQQVLFQISQFTGSPALSGITCNFEATLNGADWLQVDAFSVSGNNYRTSTYWDTSTYGTSAVIWRANTSGYKQFRIRCSGITAGIVDVFISALSTPWSQQTAFVRRGYSNDLAVSEINTASLFTTSTGTMTNTLYAADTPNQRTAPTIAPTQPSTFVNPLFYKYPQRVHRLRTQIGGSEMLPFAQEPDTLELKVTYKELYRLVEEMLLHIKMLNINFANSNNLPIPNGMESEII